MIDNYFLSISRKVGIVGSRRRNELKDFEKLNQFCDNFLLETDVLVSGGCKKGADKFAEIIAKNRNIPIEIYYPNLDNIDQTKNYRFEYAKAAYARNTLIANNSDILIAVVASDRKGGTEDTIKKFCKKHKRNESRLIEDKLLFII